MKLLFLIFFLLSTQLHAREPYHARITVGSESDRVSAPNILDLTRALKTSALEEILPAYTPTSPLALNLNIRGIEAVGSFAANSTALNIDIPQANISETFNGGTRDDSLKLFKDYLHDAGRKVKLLKAYAKYSPIDPIAGNPTSLLAQSAQADFNLGILSPLAGCDCCWYSQPIVNQCQVGALWERAFSKGFETTLVTLPLRYSFSPDLQWAFILDVPLTYIRNGGASSFFGSVGLGLRMPIMRNWSLTPMLRLSTGGSADLCTAGTFLSAGVVSVFDFECFNNVLSISNYAGYWTSVNFWLSGVNFNYKLQEYIFKNGITYVTCEDYEFCSAKLNMNVFFTDTYFTGDRLYIKHYDEIGASVIVRQINPCLTSDLLSLSASYQFGEKHYRGYVVSLSYQF